jgi:hypothetical protein
MQFPLPNTVMCLLLWGYKFLFRHKDRKSKCQTNKETPVSVMMINIDTKKTLPRSPPEGIRENFSPRVFCMRSWPGAHCTREFTNSLAAQRGEGEEASRHHAPQAELQIGSPRNCPLWMFNGEFSLGCFCAYAAVGVMVWIAIDWKRRGERRLMVSSLSSSVERKLYQLLGTRWQKQAESCGWEILFSLEWKLRCILELNGLKCFYPLSAL